MSLLVSRSLLHLVKLPAPKLVFPLHRQLSDVSEELPALLTRIGRELEEGGVPEPQLSAEYLLSKSLSTGPPSAPVLKADWRSHPASTGLSEAQRASLSRLVECRLAQVPLQYLLGNWDFRSLTLLGRPPVFIPRPETEQLVELVLDLLPQPARDLRLLEVGPGTGAVSLAVLSETDRRWKFDKGNSYCVLLRTGALHYPVGRWSAVATTTHHKYTPQSTCWGGCF